MLSNENAFCRDAIRYRTHPIVSLTFSVFLHAIATTIIRCFGIGLKCGCFDIYALPNVKQIARGKQLHRTGRSARCFVTT